MGLLMFADFGTGQAKSALGRILGSLHLRQAVAKLQHMCLCECDRPPQIKRT